MIKRYWKPIAALVAAAILLYLGFTGWGHYEQWRARHDAAQASQHDNAAAAHAAEGGAHGQAAQDLEPTIAGDDATVAALHATVQRLREELARVRGQLASSQPTGDPGQPGAVVPSVEDPGLVARLEGLNQALAQENGALHKEVVDLKAWGHELDAKAEAYRKAYVESEKASNLKQIALQGQIEANKAARNQGRMEGGGAVLLLDLLVRAL